MQITSELLFYNLFNQILLKSSTSIDTPIFVEIKLKFLELYFGLNLYNATQTRCKMKVFMKLQTLNLKLQYSDTLTWRIRVIKYNSNRSILKSFVFSKCFRRTKLHGSCYIKKDSLLLFNLLWWLLVFENSENSNGKVR